MFVRMPRIGNSRSAATSRAIASVARLGRRDDLRDHRIVVHRHLAAFDDAGVDADAGHARLAVAQQPAGLRQESLRRILGVDARFDRVAALADRLLRPRQRLAGGDEQLRAHEIDAGDLLGDRMLDLQARVHLEEVEPRRVAVALDEELDRAGVAVAGRARGGDRRRRSCARAAPASAPATGSPRSPSDAAAAPSTRARRGARRGRGRRRRSALRRGAGARSSRSTYSVPSPNAAAASRRAAWIASSIVARVADARACPCRRRRPTP